MLDLKSLNPFHHKSKQVAKVEGGQPDRPRDSFLALRQEMDHLFDSFFNGGGLVPQNDSWNTVLPTLEVTDGEKSLTVSAELPGMSEKDVDVKLSGDLLTIEGEKSEETEKTEGERTYSERHYGKFSRVVRLPFDVKNEKIDAKFDKGVLTVTIAKPAEQQQSVKHIDVKAA